MSNQRFAHAMFYRLGLSAVFLFFLGFMVFVVIFTQSRRSGVTKIDADKMGELRKGQEQVALLEYTDRDSRIGYERRQSPVVEQTEQDPY